jgi:hypothetical protein
MGSSPLSSNRARFLRREWTKRNQIAVPNGGTLKKEGTIRRKKKKSKKEKKKEKNTYQARKPR